MRIAVCAQGGELNAMVDPRFGRCAYFIFVDTETGEHEASANPSAGATGGAGVQAARFLVSKGIAAALVGNIGPNAVAVLKAAGIKVYAGVSGTVADALSQYRQGKLASSAGATVPSHEGQGGYW